MYEEAEDEWAEGGGLEILDDEDVLWVIVGDDEPRDCGELRIVRVLSEDVDVGGKGHRQGRR